MLWQEIRGLAGLKEVHYVCACGGERENERENETQLSQSSLTLEMMA